jgi:hypothetical protein
MGRAPFTAKVACNWSQRVALRMNEIKTNALHGAATPEVLNQFIPCESRFIGVF